MKQMRPNKLSKTFQNHLKAQADSQGQVFSRLIYPKAKRPAHNFFTSLRPSASNQPRPAPALQQQLPKPTSSANNQAQPQVNITATSLDPMAFSGRSPSTLQNTPVPSTVDTHPADHINHTFPPALVESSALPGVSPAQSVGVEDTPKVPPTTIIEPTAKPQRRKITLAEYTKRREIKHRNSENDISVRESR
jgi:hypothetical protein